MFFIFTHKVKIDFKQEIESSKQEMELFLLFPGLR